MRYLCLVHTGPDPFSGLSETEKRQLDRDSLNYDKELQEGGHYLAAEALQGPESAVMVRKKSI